jgi:hypothetical protein
VVDLEGWQAVGFGLLFQIPPFVVAKPIEATETGSNLVNETECHWEMLLSELLSFVHTENRLQSFHGF